MRVISRVRFLILVAALAGLTAGCHKKVAVAPAAPLAPPAKEVAPTPPNTPTASLIAEPSTILPGQTVTLKWSTTDAEEAEISGLGAVSVTGTMEIRPTESTLYE